MALPSEGRLSFVGTPAPLHRNGGSIYSGVPMSHFFPFSFYSKQTDSSGSTVQIYVTNFNCFMMAYSMTSSCYLEIYMGLGELKMEYTYFEAWED